jgi:MFS family permease
MKKRHLLLVLLSFLSMLTFFDRACISVAGPRMQKDLGITPVQWGWVVGAFSLAYAAFEIPTGMWGDRFGARRVITRIVLWWSAFTALTGVVRSFGVLVAIRFLFGVGEAGAFPNISGVVSRWFPAKERARTQGWIWTATRLGGASSAILVVPLQAAYGWRTAFWIFGSVGIFWVAIWYWWYRDSPAEKAGITQKELDEIGVQPVPQRRMPPWRQLLGSANVRAIMLMYFCYCYAGYFFISWLPTFLVKSRGFSERDLVVFTPLPFLFGAVSNLAGGFTGDYLVGRIGLLRARRLIGVGALTASGCLVLSASVAPGKYSAIILLSLAYACSDFMLPSAWSVCVDVGKWYSGTVSGAMNTAGQFGSFISGVLFGYMVKLFHSYDAPIVVIGVMLLISATQWLRIDATREAQAPPQPATSSAKPA